MGAWLYPARPGGRRGRGRSGSSVLGVVEVRRSGAGHEGVLAHGCPPEVGAWLDGRVGPAAVGLVAVMSPTQGREVRVGGLATVGVWGDVVDVSPSSGSGAAGEHAVAVAEDDPFAEPV